jgi:hypothetical protein
MAERGRRTSDGGNNNKTAAAYVPIKINTKPAGTEMRKTKLEEVPEDLILQIMWEKRRAPLVTSIYSPAWKPRPNDPGDEQLMRVYEKARAIIRLSHRHVDDLILQYINNGCAYEEVQIGDDD